MHIKTVAAILAWLVVALLILNRLFNSEWILPISLVLTAIAVLAYFSPRLRKGKKTADKGEQPPLSDQIMEH